jgi:hypothetical protein
MFQVIKTKKPWVEDLPTAKNALEIVFYFSAHFRQTGPVIIPVVKIIKAA